MPGKDRERAGGVPLEEGRGGSMGTAVQGRDEGAIDGEEREGGLPRPPACQGGERRESKEEKRRGTICYKGANEIGGGGEGEDRERETSTR